MEVLVSIALLVLACAFLFEKLTNFIKQLHTVKPKGLLAPGKSLHFDMSISSEGKKEKLVSPHTNFKNNGLD